MGFSVTLLSSLWEVLGCMCGSVPGEQTVNRGELFAVLLAMYRTAGQAELVSDSSYVQKPFAEDIDDLSGSRLSHLDLWGLLEQATAERDGKLDILKVASHKDAGQAARENIPWHHWFGNHLADEGAKWAAARAALAPSVVQEVERIDAKVLAAQERLGALLLNLPDRAERKQEIRPKPAKQNTGQEDGQGEPCDEKLAPPPPPPLPTPAAMRHAIHVSGQFSWCLQCKKGKMEPAGWDEPCLENSGLQSFAGNSRSLAQVNLEHRAVVLRGVLLCVRCGRWSKQRIVKLAGRCLAPGLAGQQALRAVAQGRELHNLRDWPLEA